MNQVGFGMMFHYGMQKRNYLMIVASEIDLKSLNRYVHVHTFNGITLAKNIKRNDNGF